MQMFVLSVDPILSAKSLADVHVRVICREVSMCLSSWYAKNIGYTDELPYRAFNHPVIDQFDNPYTRKWAMDNAEGVFRQFTNRFDKQHASEIKYDMLWDYIIKYDKELYGTFYYKYIPFYIEKYATFSFVEKDKGVIKNLSIHDAVEKYREYYRNKLNTMKVPVTYTKTIRPEWSI